MIIRITVNDNDFTEILENFADVMFDKLYFGSGKKMDFETCKTINEIQHILNPNITTSITKEQSVILRGTVFLDWCDYVDALPETDLMTGHTRNYLKRTLNFLSDMSLQINLKTEKRCIILQQIKSGFLSNI